MPRSLRNSAMMPPAAPSTAYISGANLNAFTTSGGQSKWVVRAGYIDLGRVYTIDKFWTYCTTAGVAGAGSGNCHIRVYAASADGGPPATGASPIYAGANALCTSSGVSIIWTPSTPMTLQRFYLAWIHDCVTTAPVMLRVSTSGANRGMPASAAGVEPASSPLINGWTWTEASYLTTNTWNNGSAVGVTTDMPAFCFRVA